ncbi:hypothetical protein HHK36_029315 [Tetracentron sinense]|uniref:Uncharacterized protein n=1 Tax=Tetracentron sinense TaxID=13715 RepID=A0A834YD18_TETSI|nr:hypothetical protein HHK36_029315 [Tetracentron sinense]
MMKLFDSHCHLQDPRIFHVAPEIVRTAVESGVIRFAVNGVSEKDWHLVKKMGEQYPCIIPCFGLHPWYVAERTPNWLNTLREFLEATPSAAVGEVQVFRQQLELAKAMKRPVSIHCVRAFGDLLEIMQYGSSFFLSLFSPDCSPIDVVFLPLSAVHTYFGSLVCGLVTSYLLMERCTGPFPAGAILHSYLGSAEMVPELAKLGAYFSFSGYLMSMKAQKAKRMLKAVSTERILLESDAPDALPKSNLESLRWVEGNTSVQDLQNQGANPASDVGDPSDHLFHASRDTPTLPKETLNHPANIHNVLCYVASLLEMSEEELAKVSYENAVRLFSYPGSKVLGEGFYAGRSCSQTIGNTCSCILYYLMSSNGSEGSPGLVQRSCTRTVKSGLATVFPGLREGIDGKAAKESKREPGFRVEQALKSQEPTEGLITVLRKEANGFKLRVEQDFGAFGRWQEAVVCSVGGPHSIEGCSKVVAGVKRLISIRTLQNMVVGSERDPLSYVDSGGLETYRAGLWRAGGDTPSTEFFTDLEVTKIQVKSELRDIPRFLTIKFHSISYPVEILLWGNEWCECDKSLSEVLDVGEAWRRPVVGGDVEGVKPRGKSRLENNEAGSSQQAAIKKSENIFLNSNCCTENLQSGVGNVRVSDGKLPISKRGGSTKVRWKQKDCAIAPVEKIVISNEVQEIPIAEGVVPREQRINMLEEVSETVRRPLYQLRTKKSATGSKHGRGKKKRNSLRRLHWKKARDLSRIRIRDRGGEDKEKPDRSGSGSGSGLGEGGDPAHEMEQTRSLMEAQLLLLNSQDRGFELWASDQGPVAGENRDWRGPNGDGRALPNPFTRDAFIPIAYQLQRGFRSRREQGVQRPSKFEAIRHGNPEKEQRRRCWSALECLDSCSLFVEQPGVLRGPVQGTFEEECGSLRTMISASSALPVSQEQIQVDSDPFNLASLFSNSKQGRRKQTPISAE